MEKISTPNIDPPPNLIIFKYVNSCRCKLYTVSLLVPSDKPAAVSEAVEGSLCLHKVWATCKKAVPTKSKIRQISIILIKMKAFCIINFSCVSISTRLAISVWFCSICCSTPLISLTEQATIFSCVCRRGMSPM